MKTLFFVFTCFLYSESIAADVSGYIKNTAGDALPFATIIVKGTTLGVTSNSAGFYTLKLAPGRYRLEAHYVGYATAEKEIIVGDSDEHANFVLQLQQLELPEVIVTTTGEDPAYGIIRNAIRMRPFYLGQVNAFSADVYIKGMGRMLHMPERVMGKTIPPEDIEEMGLDSNRQGIVYLAESLTRVFFQKPDKLKMEVVSNRTSGGGFGFDFPVFVSFYENSVKLFSNTFGKRGFVSPIAEGALGFYRYKYLGSFSEGGKKVNSILVTPRRKYEPLFGGILNITDNDWRIFSCRLYLTKESQLQFIDSIEISQIYTPQSRDIWRVKNQRIYVHFDQMNVEMEGDFVNIYNNYNLNPEFSKDFFDRTIIRYDTAANKRPETYWDTIRPIPLEADEIKDFEVKDSLRIIRDSTFPGGDSLRRMAGKNTPGSYLVNDAHWVRFSKNGNTIFTMEGLLKGLQYNTVEGVSINPSFTFSQSPVFQKYRIGAIADIRYGFNNKHLNPWTGVTLSKAPRPGTFDVYNNFQFFAAGGKRVSQFFKMAPLPEAASSISTLLYGWNEMKLYENYFFKTGYKRSWDNGSKLIIEGIWEDRLPLDNSTDYIFNKKFKYRITPNYPQEIMDAPFERHQATVLHASFSMQPGQRYIQYPDFLQSLGSVYPVFTVHYYKGIKDLMGSDESFDRWQLDMKGDRNMRLAGRLKYFVSTGGFFNSKAVFAPDFKHFYGTHWHVADEYGKSFQNTTMYQYSNTSPFYTEVHLEHHADGLITNKIPLLRKWNWNLVDGINGLFVQPDQKHLEIFAGLENILKVFRIDALMTLRDGYKPVFSYRIGFGGLIGDVLNAENLDRRKKIIDTW